MPEAVSTPPRNYLALVAALTLASCHGKQQSQNKPISSGPTVAPSASSRHPTTEPQARQTAQIPGGTLRAGSTPGDPGRVPELEAKNQEVELGPFGMDRLPYPNDPAEPALLGKTRDEARRLCA